MVLTRIFAVAPRMYACFPKKPILWEKKKKRRLVTNRASQRTRAGTLSKVYGEI